MEIQNTNVDLTPTKLDRRIKNEGNETVRQKLIDTRRMALVSLPPIE